MKRTILAIIAALLIIPFVLGACDKKKDDTPVIPDVPETQEAESKDAAPENLNEVVAKLIDNYNTLLYVDTLSLERDYDVEYYDEYGYLYNPITDPDFQSIGDIWDFLYDTFTTDGALAEFPDMANLGLDDPPYWYIVVDEEGFPKGLYGMQVGNGFSTRELNGDIEITDKTDDSFTAICPVQYFALDTTMTLHVVKEGSKWKIDSIDYDDFSGGEYYEEEYYDDEY